MKPSSDIQFIYNSLAVGESTDIISAVDICAFACGIIRVKKIK
jgi:hypothetical protein